jgi:shikimate kinase
MVSAPNESKPQSSAPRIVALTGFMGAGKTSIGRALAGFLGWSFVDLDQKIEAQERMTVREIFRLQGELRFRELETETLRHLLAELQPPAVLALGGGTFLQAGNAVLLRDAGARVVFLEPTVEEMLERCGIETQSAGGNLRPLASDAETFRALYAQRLPQYRKGDLTVNTAGKSVQDNARMIAISLQLGDNPV